MYREVRRRKSQDNSIFITPDGERLDMRRFKAEGGKIVMSKGERRNKYGAHSATFLGKRYHSKAEAEYAQELELRSRASDIVSWSRQVKIPLIVNGYLIANYYCDFLVVHKDMSRELIEVKGMETEIYRLKRKLLEATYLRDNPDVTYTVVRV